MDLNFTGMGEDTNAVSLWSCTDLCQTKTLDAELLQFQDMSL